MEKTQMVWIFLPVLILSVSFLNCAGSQISESDIMFEKSPPFTIEEAYFQKWVSGMKEGGSGIRIHIILESKKPEVEMREVFFQNQIRSLVNYDNNKNEFIAQFPSKPLRDVIMDIDPIEEAKNVPFQKFPFELNDNEAVISYLAGEDIKYFKVSNLVEKAQIAYPQSNSNIRN